MKRIKMRKIKHSCEEGKEEQHGNGTNRGIS
jgi:hypothetical protein